MEFILSYYDNGAPVYITTCGMYQLVRHRHGAVDPKTKKAEKDYYRLYILRGLRSNDWVPVGYDPIKSIKDAISIASRHQALLNAQLELSKELNDSSDTGSRKTGSRRSKNTSARGTKRNKGKRKVSKTSNRRDD